MLYFITVLQNQRAKTLDFESFFEVLRELRSVYKIYQL